MSSWVTGIGVRTAKILPLALIIAPLLQAAQLQEKKDDLASILDAMQKRAEKIKDLKCVTKFSWSQKDLRGKKQALKPVTAGTFSFRSSGEVGWRVYFENDLRGQSFTGQKQGLEAWCDGTTFLLHVPWFEHHPGSPRDYWRNQQYGTPWLRAELSAQSPPTMPLLAEHPELHPAILLFDLSPKKYLSTLPGLKVLGRIRDGTKTLFHLVSEPADSGPEALTTQAYGTEGNAWYRSEFWIDSADSTLFKMTSNYINRGEPKWHKECTYEFRSRTKVGDVDGIPQVIAVKEGSGKAEVIGDLALADLRINEGIGLEDIRLATPEARIVRDWILQPPAIYEKILEKDPSDASMWLNLAAARLRFGPWAEVEKAVRKVIGLKPKAVEGYLGLVYLNAITDAADWSPVVQELEKGIKAGLEFPIIHLELAERYGDLGNRAAMRGQFEAALKIIGEHSGTIREMARAAASPEERRSIFVRSIKADLANGVWTFGFTLWQGTQPPMADRLALARIYEDAIGKKGDEIWIRAILIEIYLGAGMFGDARGNAVRIVGMIERRQSGWDRWAADGASRFFRSARDYESLRRMRDAFASRPELAEKEQALRLECELVASEKEASDQVRFLDERLKPVKDFVPARDFVQPPQEPYNRFAISLKEEKKLKAFAEHLIKTLADPSVGSFHHQVLEWILNEFLDGSDAAEVGLKLKRHREGPSAGGEETLRLAQILLNEGKWEAADASTERYLTPKSEVRTRRFDL